MARNAERRQSFPRNDSIPEAANQPLYALHHSASAALLRWSVWVAGLIVALCAGSLWLGWFHHDPITPDAEQAVSSDATPSAPTLIEAPSAAPAISSQTSDEPSTEPAAPAYVPPVPPPAAPPRAVHTRNEQATASISNRPPRAHEPHKSPSFFAKVRQFFHRASLRKEPPPRNNDLYQKS